MHEVLGYSKSKMHHPDVDVSLANAKAERSALICEYIKDSCI